MNIQVIRASHDSSDQLLESEPEQDMNEMFCLNEKIKKQRFREAIDVRVTPAMEGGVTNHVWSLEELPVP